MTSPFRIHTYRTIARDGREIAKRLEYWSKLRSKRAKESGEGEG